MPGDIFGLETGDVHRFSADASINTTVWLARRESLFRGLTEVVATLTLVNRSRGHAGKSIERIWPPIPKAAKWTAFVGGLFIYSRFHQRRNVRCDRASQALKGIATFEYRNYLAR